MIKRRSQRQRLLNELTRACSGPAATPTQNNNDFCPIHDIIKLLFISYNALFTRNADESGQLWKD
jgi:hypothetical protein